MWKITYDWLDRKKIHVSSKSFDQAKWDSLPSEQKTKFKLYDDDGNLYYDGMTSDIDEDEELAFAPLNWAEYAAGCTYLKYKDKNGEWRIL